MYPDSVRGPGDPVSALGPTVNGCRFEGERRFHNEMEPSIRPDQQSKILIFAVHSRSRYIEDALRVFEKAIHTMNLSAGLACS